MLNILNNINDRLRSEIERIGVSELARSIGSARNTLYNWCEKGNIPLDKLILLGEYGVDVSYVLTGKKEQKTLTDEESFLIVQYRKVTEQIQKKVFMFLLGAESEATPSVVHNQNNNVNGQQIGNNNTQHNNHETKQKASIKVHELSNGSIVGIKNK